MKIVIATNTRTDKYELHRDGCAHLKSLYPHGPAQEYERVEDAFEASRLSKLGNGDDKTETIMAPCLRESPTVNAPAVSRLLRKAGYGVVATRGREGLLVSRSPGGAIVTAQFNSEETALSRAIEVAEFLGNEGFTARADEQIVRVSRVHKSGRRAVD